MINKDVQARLERILMGKEPRDRTFEDQQARIGHIQEEVERKAKYAKENPPARSQREMELEQREFDLKMFGREAMERFARPLEAGGRLFVPGDLQGHEAGEKRPVPPPGLKLQNHAACPIRQKLVLQRG
jgi:hypothetical protein